MTSVMCTHRRGRVRQELATRALELLLDAAGRRSRGVDPADDRRPARVGQPRVRRRGTLARRRRATRSTVASVPAARRASSWRSMASGSRADGLRKLRGADAGHPRRPRHADRSDRWSPHGRADSRRALRTDRGHGPRLPAAAVAAMGRTGRSDTSGSTRDELDANSLELDQRRARTSMLVDPDRRCRTTCRRAVRAGAVGAEPQAHVAVALRRGRRRRSRAARQRDRRRDGGSRRPAREGRTRRARKYLRTPATLIVGSVRRRQRTAHRRESRRHRGWRPEHAAGCHRARAGQLLGFVPERRQRRDGGARAALKPGRRSSHSSISGWANGAPAAPRGRPRR